MKYTLAEAVLILDNKIKEGNALILIELEEVKFNKYRKENGEKSLEHEPHENTVDEVMNKLDKIRKEIRKLKCYIREANYKIKVNFKLDNEEISLYEALLLIKQYRNEYDVCKNLGNSKASSNVIVPENSYRFSNDMSYEQIKEPTYNTKKYRTKSEKLEVLITKLEIAINQANYGNEISLDGIEVRTAD